MKKIIFLLTAIFTLFGINSAFADDTADAYVENNRISVVQSALSGKYSEGARGYFVFYDANGTLCGAALAQSAGDSYTAVYKDGYARAKLLILQSGSQNRLYSLNNAKKNIFPSPSPTPSPAPSKAPEPEDEEDGDIGESYEIRENQENNVCYISIDCLTAVTHEGIDEALLSSLPADGVIAPVTEIEVTDQMTVYDALDIIAEDNGIEISGSRTYVSGINGLSEFDCGPLSGWMYFVNGDEPQISMADYEISAGDEIQIRYTCNIGEDLR